jgi:hypothetical protein
VPLEPCLHLGLGGRPVLICPAHEDSIVSSGTRIARIAVGGQDAANDVAKVWHVIDIRQRACNEDVASACVSRGSLHAGRPRCSNCRSWMELAGASGMDLGRLFRRPLGAGFAKANGGNLVER